MAYTDEVLADSPDIYYRMDETSGTTITDSSGNGNHGTLNGAPPVNYAVTGISDDGNAAMEIGSGDYLSIPYITYTDFTFEFIFKADSLVAHSGGNLGALWMGVGNFDVLKLWTNYLSISTSSGSGFIVPSEDFANDEITHFVLTHSGTTFTLYKNGVNVGSETIAGDFETIWLFRADPGAAHYFSGVVDEIAIYPTALSSTRVAAHAGALSPAPSIPVALARQNEVDMIFDFPQFFGNDRDVKSWSGFLINSIRSAFDRTKEVARTNILYATDESTSIGTGYTEIVSVSLKSSGALVKLEFGTNSAIAVDMKLVRNGVDEIEIIGASGSSVWIDADHEYGVITYSLEVKGGSSSTCTDTYLIATELKGI
jgi:hypothetical protein